MPTYSKNTAWDNESVVTVFKLLAKSRSEDLKKAVAEVAITTHALGEDVALVIDHAHSLTTAALMSLPLNGLAAALGRPGDTTAEIYEGRRRMCLPIPEGAIRCVVIGTRACWADIPVNVVS